MILLNSQIYTEAKNNIYIKTSEHYFHDILELSNVEKFAYDCAEFCISKQKSCGQFKLSLDGINSNSYIQFHDFIYQLIDACILDKPSPNLKNIASADSVSRIFIAYFRSFLEEEANVKTIKSIIPITNKFMLFNVADKVSAKIFIDSFLSASLILSLLYNMDNGKVINFFLEKNKDFKSAYNKASVVFISIKSQLNIENPTIINNMGDIMQQSLSGSMMIKNILESQIDGLSEEELNKLKYHDIPELNLMSQKQNSEIHEVVFEEY